MLQSELSSRPSASDNRTIRTKIAVLLANVCERTYPQLWPSMIDDFIQVWLHSTLPRYDDDDHDNDNDADSYDDNDDNETKC